jgi:ABC-type lipoprotein export system ATPase subunit
MYQYQIECISLSKQFKGKRETVNAVTDISLSIRKNEMIVLKGRSGAGKSTLLNLMCGLIKPSNGKVLIDNNCISEMQNNTLSELLLNRIGIIFQSFNLLPTYTVYENIEIALVPKGLNRQSYNEKIFSLLEQFNLKDKSQLFPSELSSGQQQKVAIIRTLIKEPSIIFADEPTGSVDEVTALEILEHLKKLKNEKHLTLVIATHGNSFDRFADHVFTLEYGRINN